MKLRMHVRYRTLYPRYIYIFKKKEREGGIEFYSRQHKPRRSYPIPVKRFCKKARCIKRKRIVCNAFLIQDVLACF